MRRQAAAITASGLDRRLDLPLPRDGIRRLASTLNDLLGRLDDAASRDREFLERASHELRTPLTSLKAELEVAATGERTVEAMSLALDSAREEADRLVRLANDLLVLARTVDGQLPIRREDLLLPMFLDTATAAHHARAASHGIRITALCSSREAVRIDPMRARQAIDNLLDNALRHASAGDTVLLAGALDGDTLTLSVEDSGPGFADGPSHDVTSDGLGLRTARAIAISHGGDLAVANRAEGGAVVTLTFGQARSKARPAD
jgi:signal transduction histidine kinase